MGEHTSAAAARPAPGGGPGTLTIIDNRTGKKYDVKIDEGGVIKATDLKKIVAGGDEVGLKTYDPGCALDSIQNSMCLYTLHTYLMYCIPFFTVIAT